MITREEDIVNMDEEEFIRRNERLVHSVCQSIYSSTVKRDTGLEYEDLLQIGLLGMLKAKRRFDPSYGCKFSTFAVPAIRNEVIHHIYKNGNVFVSRSVKEIFNEIVKLGLGDEDVSVIAEKLGVSVKQANLAKRYSLQTSSLNAEINEDDGVATFLENVTTGESAADIAEDRITLQEFLSSLTPNEMRLWEAYKELGKQSLIAEKLGVSQPVVSRALKRIFLKAEDFGRQLGVRT